MKRLAQRIFLAGLLLAGEIRRLWAWRTVGDPPRGAKHDDPAVDL